MSCGDLFRPILDDIDIHGYNMYIYIYVKYIEMDTLLLGRDL